LSVEFPVAESSKTPLLDLVQTPADLRRLESGQLRQLADELRQETVDAVAAATSAPGWG
jgi:1-deoxy-D-xylulose-5-phosphate synthase